MQTIRPVQPVEAPPLGPTDLHWWFFPWAESPLPATDVALPRAELARAERFRFEIDRTRFVQCRAALRLLLARYTGARPVDLRLREGAHGKPALDSPDLPTLHFNLSHSHTAAVLAFSRVGELGVDLEETSRSVRPLELGRRVFTEVEQRELEACADGPDRVAQFFRYWTAKEAFLKAVGRGLSLDPASFQAELPEDGGTGHFTSSTPGLTDGWQLKAPMLPDPFKAALVAEDLDNMRMETLRLRA